ncbi:MAG: alpha/beta hydrolase [Pseudomonadota bacterium]
MQQKNHAFDPVWLDSMYNNRALVPDAPAYFERWGGLSRDARTHPDCAIDVRFGKEPGEQLDVFQAPGKTSAPVLIFIHGGYWRALDKADHSFVAPAFTTAGACVVVPNYDLCPATTVPGIVMQMVRAVEWTFRNIAAYGGDPQRISVVGHSAGGHLAAMMLASLWQKLDPRLPADVVKGALSISGLYDLEPIMHTPFLKEALRLTPEQVLKTSPAWMPAPSHGKLYAVYGGNESAEFKRQNELIQKVWGKKVVPVQEGIPGRNHFSVLDALVEPDNRLYQLTRQLLGL